MLMVINFLEQQLLAAKQWLFSGTMGLIPQHMNRLGLPLENVVTLGMGPGSLHGHLVEKLPKIERAAL